MGRILIKNDLEQLEEWAFYESGLSADGCLEKLDPYAREAIKRYGRCLLKKENIDLKQQLRDIEEDGTEEHNAAIELRQKLAQSLLENEKVKLIAKKLYGVVLHVYEIAKQNSVVVIGPSLFDEAYSVIKDYEQCNDIREI
jgi:hypothetical protein